MKSISRRIHNIEETLVSIRQNPPPEQNEEERRQIIEDVMKAREGVEALKIKLGIIPSVKNTQT